MSDWPPKPESEIQKTTSTNNVHQPTGNEWKILEKAVLASVEEQRRTRRWGIFFKFLTFAYILFVLVALGKGCSTASSTSSDAAASSSHIAVVDIIGTIAADKQSVNSTDTIRSLKRAFENKQSKAVVLNINSPGGSPVQSDQIWQTMMDLRKQHPDKKLYAVIGDMGASGAYYIASAADEIYVNPSSLVGSIGVIMPGYNVEGLMKKAGVKDTTMTAGEYKDILSISRDLSDYERQHIESVLNNTHKHFINAVKEGRGNRLKNPEQNKLFSGLFWTGEQSIELGLADKKGSISSLEKQLKLKNVVNYTPTDPFSLFMDRFAVKLGAGLGSSIKLDVLPQEEGNAQMR